MTPKSVLTADAIAWGQPAGGAKSDDLTEARHAERFAAAYGREFKHDFRRGLWLRWDAGLWSDDRTGHRYVRAVELARRLYKDAAGITDIERRRRTATFAIGAESRNRIEATLHLAKFQPPIADTGDGWDTGPLVLNTPGGVVDLRTCLVRPATASDRLLLRTAVAPASTAECPRWLRFLEEIFAGDVDVIAWFFRFCGYLLTGATGEQCFVIGWGGGANGKGTCFNTLAAVMGSYAYNLPFSALELHQRTSIPNDLASLVNRRLVTASESGESTRLNESRIKMLTGGDTVTARFLHSEFFEFVPVAKFVLFTNAKPIVRDDAHGMWRRIRLLPFTQTFPINKTLKDELLAEGPGILRWMLDGCLAWQRDGLTTPATIAAATHEYQVDQDHVQQFLDAQCNVGPSESCRAGELFKAYKAWCDAEDCHPRERLSHRRFGTKMKTRFDSVEDGRGWRYLGVGLGC
jgi:putative DNA primase/helicase